MTELLLDYKISVQVINIFLAIFVIHVSPTNYYILVILMCFAITYVFNFALIEAYLITWEK